MSRKYIALSIIIFIGSMMTFAESNLIGFDARRDTICSWAAATNAFPRAAEQNPKQNLPVCLARLYLSKGTDPVAIEYLAKCTRYIKYGDTAFGLMGLGGAIYRFGSYLPSNLQDTLFNDLQKYITNYHNTGTDNGRHMAWSGAYLIAQYFPNGSWWWDGSKISSEQLKAYTKELLFDWCGKNYSYGNIEFVSPNYEIFDVISLVHLAEFAQDEEVRSMAEASLAYRFAYLSSSQIEGHMMAPFCRTAIQTNTRPLSNTQWITWLYYGFGAPIINDVRDNVGSRNGIYLAISNWYPHSIFSSLIRKELPLPMVTRSTNSYFGYEPTRRAMRTVFLDQLYSIGSGNFRRVPGEFALDDAMFNIAWASSAQYNYIEVMHPYWRSDDKYATFVNKVTGERIVYKTLNGEDNWTGSHSPFQQFASFDNAAIVLFNIPDVDPWPASDQWWGERDEHANNLLKLGQFRFPTTMELVKGKDNWLFLREPKADQSKEVYIAVNVLQSDPVISEVFNAKTNPTQAPSSSGFFAVKSFASKTGFIFDVGTAKDYGSFVNFQNTIYKHKVNFDESVMKVEYKTIRGLHVELKYNPDVSRIDGTIPEVRIQNKLQDFTTWPILENSYMSLKDRILTVVDGNREFIVNWSNPVPTITEKLDPSANPHNGRWWK